MTKQELLYGIRRQLDLLGYRADRSTPVHAGTPSSPRWNACSSNTASSWRPNPKQHEPHPSRCGSSPLRKELKKNSLFLDRPSLPLRVIRSAMPAVVDGLDCSLETIGLAGSALQHGIGTCATSDLGIFVLIFFQKGQHPLAPSNHGIGLFLRLPHIETH